MASRYYDNSDGAQRFQPGTTARADEVDAKLDRVAAGFEQAEQDIDRSIKLPTAETSQELNASPLQRRRRVVGFDADGNLTLLQGFSWRGNWATATEYFVNDVFRDPATKNIYVTVTRHTSAAALSTDITAGRVELAINVEDVEAAKAAAEAARNLSMQHRDESRTARDASQAAQGLSETARDKSQAWAETPENTEVEPGQYSSLHHKAKSQQAQALSEQARNASQTARDASQAAQTASESARDLSRQYRDTAEQHRNNAQAARDKAQQWAEAEGEVEPGQRSAKYWAGQAEEVAAGNLPITSLQPGALDTEKDYVSVDAQGALVRRNLATDVSAQLTAGNESAKLTRYDLASISTTATLDLATGNAFTVDASAPRTLTLANVPAMSRDTTVKITLSGAAAITWPAGIRWHGDGTTAPELGATWTIVILSKDGLGNISGVLGAKA